MRRHALGLASLSFAIAGGISVVLAASSAEGQPKAAGGAATKDGGAATTAAASDAGAPTTASAATTSSRDGGAAQTAAGAAGGPAVPIPEKGSMDGATYGVRLRDLEARVDELKDQIRRSHTRLALLSDTILS